MDTDRVTEKNLKSHVPNGSIWEHWKSTPEEARTYIVVGLARSEATKRIVVNYFPLYLSDTSDGIPWSRDLKEFLACVKTPTGKVQRFRRLHE